MNIPISNLGLTTSAVNFASINDLGSGAARQTVSYVKINYPHTLDLEGQTNFNRLFVNLHPSEPKSYLNFTNFNASGNVLFYELTNGKRINVVSSGPSYKCLVPNSSSSSVECYVSSIGQVKSINLLSPVNGTGNFVDYITSAIDTAFVIITHPSLMADANTYANHRLNGPGNNPENPIVFNVEDLYDQFAYGIEKHPNAIRGFIDYIYANWPSKPKYLFFIR